MTLGTFKAMVAAFMQRDASVFFVGGVDLLTQAANMARRWAERQHNFELCKTTGAVSIHYTNGALRSAIHVVGSETLLPVKAIQKAYLPYDDGSGYFPIEILTRDAHISAVSRHYEMAMSTDPNATEPPASRSFFSLVQHGETLYVVPADSDALGGDTIEVRLDVVKWLTEYSADSDSDFFLNYCADWLLLKVVYILNFFLKEDMRVAISDKAMEKAWAAVLAWDSNQVLNAAEDVQLD